MRKTRLILAFAVIAFFSFIGFANAQTAKLQIIHNSADALVDEVDIYVNGNSFLTDVGFRQATNFMDVPAGVDLNIIVAPAGAGIGNGVGPITVNLTADETYIAIASGTVSATGYDPATPFSLEVFTPAREQAQNATDVDVLVYHGATDAPEVSVWVMGGTEALFNFEYSDFAGYLSLPEADYVLEVRTADGETVVASYVAPLETLQLEGAAITVVASGFLNPANNSNGAAFGLFVATAAGGELIALPVYEPEPETARAQIIHNAADLAAANVDVFVNGEMFVPNFAFRTATPFVDVPAGVELTIDIAPAGAGIENSVFDITVTFDADETYVIVANGIVSASGYDPIEPFSVYPFAPAREAGENANETDLLVFHGSTDAPEVSVWAMGGESALFTFEYGDFAGYLGLPTDDYVIEIRTADGETTVVAYVAPLATLELEGAALTVVASGFLNPANNSNGPAFGLFVATPAGGDLIALPVYEPEPETARAQIIHNAADLAAANVDVFVNGEMFVPNFAFRTATPFVDVPAGVELTIDIAPAGAGIENSVFDITVTFDADETYVIVANGIVSASGYDPIEPFTVYPFAPAREAGENANETDLLVFHGSTDAPEVSVWAMGGESALFTFEYGDFAGYLGLPTDDYVIEIRTADGETTVVAYVAPLATLELEGAALTVVASGFLNPANNSNGPAFGLFVATPAGGDLIALPVYEEQEPVIVGFPFFEDFETPENYSNWMIIDGSGSGFGWEIGDNDNFVVSDPMGGSFASVDSDAAGSGNYVWSILQAPIIDLSDFEGGNIELSFAHHYRQIGNQVAYVKISNDGENWETIATYNSNQGSSTGFSGPFAVTAVTETLIIEGYTSDDMLYIRFEFDDNETWGWYWMIDNISVNVATEEPPMARAQIIHNAADMAAANVDVFVNGELFIPDFAFRTATSFANVPAGVELTFDIAPAGAGIENSVFDITVTFEADETYIIIANGIVSDSGYDPVEPFTVFPFAGAREEANNANETDVLVFHGATDAPEVSIWETGVGAGELFSFAYGEYAGYLELGTLDYVLEVRTADGETTVVAYSAPLQTLGLDGAAITVVASGFLNPANNSNGPAFGLYVALPSGGDLIALPVYEEPQPEFARAQIIHNAADMAAANVDVFVNGEIFVPDFAFRTATPFVDVPAGVELTIDIAPAGAGIESSVFDITVTFEADETYIIVANGIVSGSGYSPVEPFTVYPYAGAREMASNANETDVLVFHGATDAPVVSVWETGVGAGQLFSFGYGRLCRLPGTWNS
jgi:hypothetical protein